MTRMISLAAALLTLSPLAYLALVQAARIVG